MSGGRLSADQRELADEISEDEPSDEAVEALTYAIGRFNYTTTVLAVLSDYVRDNVDDPDGAEMVLEFSEKMAEHEARTL